MSRLSSSCSTHLVEVYKTISGGISDEGCDELGDAADGPLPTLRRFLRAPNASLG